MLNQKLVDELRQMFLDGATPSRLMSHIANHHKGDRRIHFIIKDYFREAFGIQLLRNVLAEEDYSPSSRHAHYNRDVVPEMIQRISDWSPTDLSGSWLEGLSGHSLAEHTERLQAAHFEELDRVWDDLTDNEKQFIIRKVAFKDYYWDVVKCLAAMAERLQQQVVELEEQLKQDHRPVPRSCPTPECP